MVIKLCKQTIFGMLLFMYFESYAVTINYDITAPTTDILGNPTTEDEIAAYIVFCGQGTLSYTSSNVLMRDLNSVMPTAYTETITAEQAKDWHCVIAAIRQWSDAVGNLVYGALGPTSAEVVTVTNPSGNLLIRPPGMCIP